MFSLVAFTGEIADTKVVLLREKKKKGLFIMSAYLRKSLLCLYLIVLVLCVETHKSHSLQGYYNFISKERDRKKYVTDS